MSSCSPTKVPLHPKYSRIFIEYSLNILELAINPVLITLDDRFFQKSMMKEKMRPYTGDRKMSRQDEILGGDWGQNDPQI